MNILVTLMQLLCTIPLFLIIEYFNNKDISIIQKILIPVVYIIVLAGLVSEIKDNIYLIVIFELILHEFYTNNISNKAILVNKREYFINALISILLSFFVYDYYISKVDYILPVANEMRSLLWFLMIIFIYGLVKDNVKQVEKNNKSNFVSQRKEYIVVMYAKFKNKYHKIIKSKEQLINRLMYAIMIYENYYNPLVSRKLKKFKSHFSNKNMKYGIMQVESSHEIDDEKSIKIVLSKLEKKYQKSVKKDSDKTTILSLLSEKYGNDSCVNDIYDIYNEILAFDNK